MATLLTPSPLNTQFNRLFDFIQNAFDLARKARLLQLEPPPNADAFTLDQADPVMEEANIADVLAVFKRIRELQVKVDDAITEMEFAINFLIDRARRKPPLPTAIGGPPFGTITSSAP
jgi:hypothetical protein